MRGMLFNVKRYTIWRDIVTLLSHEPRLSYNILSLLMQALKQECYFERMNITLTNNVELNKLSQLMLLSRVNV